MKTTVRREGERVWLEGVSGWFVGAKQSSVHAAQEAVMQALGEDLGYDYLVGVSGLGFRMQVSKEGLCPSSPHAACGCECVSPSVAALPRQLRLYQVKAEQSAEVAQVRRAVMESIDKGVPAQYGSEEDGIVVGYQRQGQEWLCYHPLREGGTKMVVEAQWPWGVIVYGGRKDRMPTRGELAEQALAQAVQMARTWEVEGYFVGFRAWEQYLEKLEALQAGSEAVRQGAMLGNAWIYECLAQHRASAASYLRSIAGEFDEAGADHLNQAADFYAQLSDPVLRDQEHCALSIAPYPWSLKEGQTWTPALIGEQLRRLRAALSLEKEAVAELEQALIKGQEAGFALSSAGA